MSDYNYMYEMKEDVRRYIETEVDLSGFEDREELEDYLNEILWAVDSVTGNASGSYTFDTYQAEENICHNLYLLAEALEEFCYKDINALEKGAEWCDVTIRCYLLGRVIGEVLDDMEEELEKVFNQEEAIQC